jgi:ATP-dependent RNA helicase RhlE
MSINSQNQPLTGGFDSLKLIEPLCRAVAGEKYTTPTPIQSQAIPHLIAGRDLLGCAQTGTGKTAAFALPILHRLANNTKPVGRFGVRALILTPTRELALQIGESFRVYGRYLKMRHTVVYGGASYKNQVRELTRGVDVLVATPGRLLDLFGQGYVRLDSAEILVLDEADRMLDMGFLPDIRRIVTTMPAKRQTMLFSATLPKEILKLSESFLTDPAKVSVTPPSSTVENIDQRVLFVERENKSALLEAVLKDESLYRVLVFTRTKHGANRAVQKLRKSGVKAEAFHGDKTQSARVQALAKFKNGKARVLVATDVASRGLDIDGISHVINYEMPKEAESYVHRIGRTARAGTTGIALSFCDEGECGYLRNIERVTSRPVTMLDSHPFHSATIAENRKKAGISTAKAKPGRRGPKSAVRRGERGKSSWHRASGVPGGRPSSTRRRVRQPRSQG